MSLYAEAVQDALNNDRGFRAHPLGEFPGAIIEVKGGTHEGRDFYEIKVKTTYGTAKQTLWRAQESDLQAYYLPKFSGDYAEAVSALKKVWARHARLYLDLGLQAPEDEKSLYENLGQLMNRECWLVVKAGTDPANPLVYINAPRSKSMARLDPNQPQPAKPAATAPTIPGSNSMSRPDFSLPPMVNMDEVPF